MSALRRPTIATALLLGLGLAGCDPRDCMIGVANHDCAPVGSPAAQFPQDDAVCRSFRLTPGTRAYGECVEAKLHERSLTERETDFGVFQNPVLPNIRPVVQAQ